MPGGAKKSREARETLERVISSCEAVEAGRVSPFSIPIDELIEVIRELFPLWKEPEDLGLDARALEAISSVIRAQSEWVRRRSTRLYKDPFLLEERVRELEPDVLATIFLRAWHPIVELEQMTALSLEAAAKYWSELPYREREPGEAEEVPSAPLEAGGVELLTEEAQKALEELWEELRRRARGGSVRYWDFITADTYAETIKRAYLTSFLITYGYASLEADPLGGEDLLLRPRTKPRTKPREKATSVAIPITYEGWLEHAD